MRANRLTVNLAASVALLAAACEPQRKPAGGAVAPAPLTDERGVLLLDGLGDLGPHIQAAMGTAAERAERAPYSPEGWPWERGDLVPWGWYMDNPFGNWEGISAPFWIGDKVFGARWAAAEGTDFLPEHEYVGHYPQKTTWEWWSLNLPDHLDDKSRTEAGFVEIAKSVSRLRGGRDDGLARISHTHRKAPVSGGC